MNVKNALKSISDSKVMLGIGLLFTAVSAASEFLSERNKDKALRELTDRVTKLESK